MHPECVEERTRSLMSCLGPTTGMHGGVLAGGTGLALQLGHRMSAGLEFFTQQPFRAADILEELQALTGTVEPVAMESDMMTVRADGALLSLTHSPFPLLDPTIRLNGCYVTSTLDAASAILLSVARGGTRLAFIDLYAVLQMLPFRVLARHAVQQFGEACPDAVAVGKGLVWFAEAETQPDPVFVKNAAAWNQVADFFRSSVRQFVLDLDAEGKSLK
jgi:hypothetical protein